MAVGDALCIFRQSADALSYALKHKIVHRDIKPENLMLTRAGQVKLTDLGLAKSLDLPAGTSLDLTDTGTGMGSPKYSAPEQTHNAKFVDQRADIYALGGTLYFLLTTDAPFKGSTALELLSAKEKNSFTPARRLNADVPPRLDLMIDKMLARDPRQRYRDYDELLHDVDALGMTNPRLSFDPSEVVPMGQSMLLHQAVQILLIDDDADDIRLARQGLEENGICSNLTALTDGAQARAYLRREGPFLVAQQPDLIIFGSKLRLPDLLLTLEEIKASDALSEIPLVVLADSAKTSEFLQTCGYKVNLIVSVPTEPDQFNDLFKSIRGLWVTVMEFKSDS
jgi:serine/threonine protein kinase